VIEIQQIEMDPNQLRVPPIREVLRRRQLQTSGRKTEMIQRLDEHDPTREWVKEAQEIQAYSIEIRAEDRCSEEEDITANNESQRTSHGKDIAQWEAALERRERDIMQREIQLLRRENETLRESPHLSTSSTTPRPSISIKSIGELLSEYSGSGVDFARWKAQAMLLRDTYELEENLLKILIGSKLRGKALSWYHSRIEHFEMKAADLLTAMQKMFDHRPGRLELRRKFEAREWRSGESFADYCHHKLILGNMIPISDDDIVDYVIDGIPAEPLQNQARMHSFDKIEDLMKAFEKIKLPAWKQKPRRDSFSTAESKSHIRSESHPSGPSSASQKDDVEKARTSTRRTSKCYQCEGTGHWARDCKYSKTGSNQEEPKGASNRGARQIGSVDSEPETSKAAEEEEHTDNDHDAEICFIDANAELRDDFQKDTVFHEDGIEPFSTTSRLDTGCPISLIKEQLVRRELVEAPTPNWQRYYGMNKSKILIRGTVILNVTLEGDTRKLILGVVSDDAMSTPVLLGRDALARFGYKLTKSLIYDKAVSEILNIEINRPIGAEQLRINLDIPIPVCAKFKEIYVKHYKEPNRPSDPKVKAEAHIILKTNQPIQFGPRRLAYAEKEKVRAIINDLSERGIVRESSSEYTSPIVLTRKKNGEIRMCIDYRSLNKIIVRDNYPLPLIEDQLDELRGKKYFSALDLKDGFYHVAMAPESIKYTSFITPIGQFEFTRMPFGLKIGPQRFQRFINQAMTHLIKSGEVIVYMDDILIATRALENHLTVIQKVFDVLVENKLELRLDKCSFLFTEIDYLGYHVTSEGLSPTDSGLAAVRNFPEPKTVKEVQSFIGLASYFRKFIKGFSLIAKPLYALLKKDTVFIFGEAETRALKTLKQKLTDAPILAIYNPKAKTELHCDASLHGFGAVLLQQQEDRTMHPVFYFSRRTTESESRYHSFELETLAIVYALRRFRIYLQGMPFVIVTDCAAVTQTLEKRDINARITRWSLELQEYDFKIVHRPGLKMRHVDALSRSFAILVVEDNPFEWNLTISQQRDPFIKEIAQRLEKSNDPQYEMRNGLVYKKKENELLFVVPAKMEKNVLFHYHNEMGHVGAEKMIESIRRTYWIPRIREKCEEHVRQCLKCISFEPMSGRREGYLHPIPKGSAPFNTLHIDHFGPVDHRVAAKKYVFLIIDAFTKFVRLYSTKTTNTREAMTHLSQYFQNYSRPRVIISDRGSAFTSHEFEEFMKEHKITHIKIATGSPQANGQVERINRILSPMLAKLSDNENSKQWYKILEQAEFAINNTVNRSTGKTPCQLLFGADQRGLIIDGLKDLVTEKAHNTSQSPEARQDDLEKMRTEAAEKIYKSQINQKKNYDKKRKSPRKYNKGELVMIKNFDNTPGISKKLIPRFRGPYEITKVLKNNRYVIVDPDGCQNTQKPYLGTWESSNMRPWLADDKSDRVTVSQ